MEEVSLIQETTPIKMNNAGSGLVLDNVIVSNVSATVASSQQGILEASNDSTVNNLSLDQTSFVSLLLRAKLLR